MHGRKRGNKKTYILLAIAMLVLAGTAYGAVYLFFYG